MEPLVSVVIIFLDAGRFLAEAIESVVRQTEDRWELILVDDGSRDDSPDIARAAVGRLRGCACYVTHPGHANRGMPASRNLGVRHARGRSIALLDADDVWLPDKLARQVAILDAHPRAAMVYGRSLYWWSWTGAPDDARRDWVRDLGVPADTLVEPPALLRGALTSTVPTPCPSDILVRTDVVRRVGGFVEEFAGIRQLFEDQAFLAKVYLRAPVFVAGECWTRYRQHPDSCVAASARAGRKRAVGLMYFRWLEAYMKQHGVTDPPLWRALHRKRFRYRHPTAFRLLERARRRLGVASA